MQSPSSDIEAPLGRFSRSSNKIGSTASLNIQHPVSDLVSLALAIRSLNGNSILVLIPVQRVVNGEQTFSCIRAFLQRVSTTNHRGTWVETFFARDVVGTAYIDQVFRRFLVNPPPPSRSLPGTFRAQR